MNRVWREGVLRWALLLLGGLAVSAGCATEFPGEPPDKTRFEFPVSLALHPEGRYLYVVSTNFDFRYRAQDGGTLSVVDLETGELLVEQTMTLASFGADMTLNHDASRGYIAVRGDHSVTWFGIGEDGSTIDCPLAGNAANRSLEDCTLPVPSEPVGLAYARSSRSSIQTDEEGRPRVDEDGEPLLTTRMFDMLAVAHLRGGNVTVMTIGDAEGSVSPSVSRSTAALVDGTSSVIREAGTERFYATGRVAEDLVAFRPAIGPDLEVLAVFLDYVLPVPTPFTNYEGRGLIFSPSGDRLYMTNQVPDALLVFDTSEGDDASVSGRQNRLIAQIDLPEGPNNMAWVPRPGGGEPLLYITIFDENEVAIVDPDLPALVGRLEVGRGPFDIVVDEARSRAYVTNFREHSVSIVDVSDPFAPVELDIVAGSARDAALQNHNNLGVE